MFGYNMFVFINKLFTNMDKDGKAHVGRILSVDKKSDMCVLLDVHDN